MPRGKFQRTIGLFSLFVEHCYELGVRLKNVKTAKSEKIKRSMEYMRKHFREEIDLTKIAKHADLSPAYLGNLFRKVTGLHFSYYLQQLRIEEAKKLLQKTDWNITRIVFEAGFNHIPHFNRVFRKLEGCSPREYRKSLKNSAS